MIKKIIAIATLMTFVVVAGYLCACVSKSAASVGFMKAHSCCNGMPNCPMKDCKETGMMSFLPLFTSKLGQEINTTKPTFLNHDALSQTVGLIQKSSRNLESYKINSFDPIIFSSPKLFIKNLVLRI